jgi:hypothetical protein
VVVQTAAPDARSREDRVDRGRLVAAAAELVARRGDQPLPCRAPALLTSVESLLLHVESVNRPSVC